MAGATRLAAILALLVITGNLTTWARPGTAVAGPASLDDQVRGIASRLRCPVCQNESVADSPSELAAQMRALIQSRLQQGESAEQIVAYFVSRYGDWILLDPPRRGLGWILWAAPAVVLLLGIGIAANFIRRTVRPDAGDADEAG